MHSRALEDQALPFAAPSALVSRNIHVRRLGRRQSRVVSLPRTDAMAQPKIKVYGINMSTCTRRVLVTLIEMGLPHELVLVDLMKGEHKQPPHLARQPFGQVPVLEDVDGFQIFESRAIIRYLAKKVCCPVAFHFA